MGWGTDRVFLHPNHHDVVVGPPYAVGDLDIVRASGLLTGAEVRHKPLSHTAGDLFAPAVIMIHSTMSIGTARQVIDDLNDQSKSAHVVIDRTGELWQAVPFNKVALHAGTGAWGGYVNNLNHHAIGIEVNNLGPLWLSEDNKFIDSYAIDRDLRGVEHKDRRLDIMAHRDWRAINLKELWKVSEPGKFDKILKKGVAESKLHLFCYWEIFPDVQIEALKKLCSLLLTRYPSIRAIIGHDEYAQLRKFDPGPALPVDKLLGWMPQARTVLPRANFGRRGHTDDRRIPDFTRNWVTSRRFGGGVIGGDID